MTSIHPRPRANVYIDGFNLYHGCFDDLKHRPHWRKYRWLDLDTFCRRLFPNYLIHRIRYFTALVDPLPNNPHNRDRQLMYIRALQTIPHLAVHQGRFATNVKDRPQAASSVLKSSVAQSPLPGIRVVP